MCVTFHVIESGMAVNIIIRPGMEWLREAQPSQICHNLRVRVLSIRVKMYSTKHCQSTWAKSRGFAPPWKEKVNTDVAQLYGENKLKLNLQCSNNGRKHLMVSKIITRKINQRMNYDPIYYWTNMRTAAYTHAPDWTGHARRGHRSIAMQPRMLVQL